MNPAAVGPITKPISHESVESAMYRPRSRGGARSATSAPWVGPWKHSPRPKMIAASPKTRAAAPALNQTPPAKTTSHVTAQMNVINARAGMRRLPSRIFVSGSWARTIASVFTKKMKPICRSVTPEWFLANTGNTSSCAYPAAT